MTIHSTAVVSVYGGPGITVDTGSSINIAIDGGFIIGMGKILYHNLLSEIEDREKRKKVDEYLKSYDEEMTSLGSKLYEELTSDKEYRIKYLARAIRDKSVNEIFNQIRFYGYGL